MVSSAMVAVTRDLDNRARGLHTCMTNPEAELSLLIGLEIWMERSYIIDDSIIDVSFDVAAQLAKTETAPQALMVRSSTPILNNKPILPNDQG
jgi:hypothetical protein